MANVFPKPDTKRPLRRLPAVRNSNSTSTGPATPSSARSLDFLSPRPISPYLAAVSPKVDCGLRRTPRQTGRDREDSLLMSYPDHGNGYDLLIQAIVDHYTVLSAAQYSGEIALLRSLTGSLDASNLPALLLLPKLPDHIQHWIRAGRPEPSLASEQRLIEVLSRFNLQQVETLRAVEQPSATFRRAVEAYMRLFSRCDREIEVGIGGQLVTSRAWEIWRDYVKKPGHMVQMARKVIEMVKTGKIGPLEMKEVQILLKSAPRDTPKTPIMLPFLRAVEAFYSEWVSLHPDLHPKRPSLNLERSAERLSRRSSTSTPTALTPKSPVSPFNTLTPKSPLRTPTSKSPFRLSIEKVHRQACMGLREIDPNVPFTETEESDDSVSPCKRPTAEAKRVEWEIELGFRRLLTSKMRDRDGDLTGENAKTLFGEMTRTVLTNEWRKRQKVVIGERKLEGIIEDFRKKLETVSFVKREALKAAMRVKAEGQRVARQRHFD